MFENSFLNTLAIFGARDLIFVMVAIAATVFFFLPKPQQKRTLLFVVILFPVSYAIATLAGFLFFNPRPFVADGFIPLLPHTADNGFPSDHSLFAAALAAAVLPYKRWVGIILSILAIGVGVSRVYVGVHHPIDILTSFLIVAVVVLAALKIRVTFHF